MSDPAAPSTTPPSAVWLVFACPSCAQSVKVKSTLAGAALLCPSCQQKIYAPGAASEEADASKPKFRSYKEFVVTEEEREEQRQRRQQQHEAVAMKNLPEWE